MKETDATTDVIAPSKADGSINSRSSGSTTGKVDLSLNVTFSYSMLSFSITELNLAHSAIPRNMEIGSTFKQPC
jgi:hypothetical protein